MENIEKGYKRFVTVLDAAEIKVNICVVGVGIGSRKENGVVVVVLGSSGKSKLEPYDVIGSSTTSTTNRLEPITLSST